MLAQLLALGWPWVDSLGELNIYLLLTGQLPTMPGQALSTGLACMQHIHTHGVARWDRRVLVSSTPLSDAVEEGCIVQQ